MDPDTINLDPHHWSKVNNSPRTLAIIRSLKRKEGRGIITMLIERVRDHQPPDSIALPLR